MDTIFSIKLQQSKDRQQRIKKSRDRLINDSRQTLKWNWMIMDMQKERRDIIGQNEEFNTK